MEGKKLINWLKNEIKEGRAYGRPEYEFFLALFSVIGFGQHLGLTGDFGPIIKGILDHSILRKCECNDLDGCPANQNNQMLVKAIINQQEALKTKE